ncbi:hypothetical protein RKE25_20610 [Dyella sp. BiH032]|uniref:hypothetical protein n=1 Tax=Dyella sp. BiH032 TaxID=3075430 RepID=UPI00289344E6|nr:hypothetical protein [Dyella sp. BiH032]WNL45784.1 hypothetical protein RKE25_20610 [Dyella sp. BiH032]
MTQDWSIDMPHPEAFECMANDLLDNFVRRNTTQEGGWAIAKLRRELEGQSPMAVELDIIHSYARPEGPVALALAEHYSGYLAIVLLNNAYSLYLITRARLLVQFGSAGDADAPPVAADGDSFHCKLSLTACDGKVYSAERVGRICDVGD